MPASPRALKHACTRNQHIRTSTCKCIHACAEAEELKNNMGLSISGVADPCCDHVFYGTCSVVLCVHVVIIQGGFSQWKAMFSERFRIRRNWLKGFCNVRTFEGHTQGIYYVHVHVYVKDVTCTYMYLYNHQCSPQALFGLVLRYSFVLEGAKPSHAVYTYCTVCVDHASLRTHASLGYAEYAHIYNVSCV